MKFSNLSAEEVAPLRWNSTRTQITPQPGEVEGVDWEPVSNTNQIIGGKSIFDGDFNILGTLLLLTNSGQLPFIFQQDQDNPHPDQFAMCVLDMKSIKLTQTGKGSFSVALKIKETW